MRFAAVPAPKPQPRSAAADFILRLTGTEEVVRNEQSLQPAPVKPAELPVELDQRVRLVGEW